MPPWHRRSFETGWRACRSTGARIQKLNEAEQQTLERSTQLAGDTRRISAQVEQLFDAYLEPLEQLVQNARSALQEMDLASPAPAERTDVILHSQPVTVSDSTLWKPWTWGRSHREYTMQEITLPYWEAEDTLDFLKAFPRELSLLWDGIYSPMTDTARLHNGLMLYAQRTLADIGFPAQAESVQKMVQRALSHLYAPRPALGTESLRVRLHSQFPSRACDPATRAQLEQACRQAVQQAMDMARRELEEGSRHFVRTVRAAQNDFCAQLLEPVFAERKQLEISLADIRRERARCQEFEEIARQV